MIRPAPLRLRSPFLLGPLILFLIYCPGAAQASPPNDDRIFINDANALAEEDLKEARGGNAYTTTTTNTVTTVTSTQTMSSASTGNSVTAGGSVTTGAISVGDTFGGNGIGSYVMNTGNNATISAGVSLSVLMQP